MSSLVSSVSSISNLSTHKTRFSSSQPNINLSKTTSLVLNAQQKQKLKPLDEKPKANGLFRRREAIGFGISLGVFETLFELNNDRLIASAEGNNGTCEFTVAPSGLAFCDKALGYGPQAVQGQLIKAHYVGKLENGKVFDSSYNRGKPLTFRVGVGEVIKGWDQGIVGGDGIPPMLTGGKRTLKIPPELGYGVRGAGCKGGSCIIPPDSVLLFDVEFVGKA